MNCNAAVTKAHNQWYASNASWSSEWSFIENADPVMQKPAQATEKQWLSSGAASPNFLQSAACLR